jgi:two-component system response regulator AtoC
MTKRLLIIEDDASLSQMLQFHFEDEGFEIATASTCSEGLQLLGKTAFDLILLDQQLPDGTGLELLQQIDTREPGPAVIMMTGQHDLELAIQAIKEGAADFVHKPIKSAELQIVVDRLMLNRRLAREVEALRPAAHDDFSSRDLIGRSDAMLQVSKEIARCASSNATVLITGESGTGKEVVARLVHTHSGLSGPFVAINCAAIVDTLLESELFGHEKGAFTGATGKKPGKFELAQDGTLFLDEIGELAQPLQAKLLRALQERVFERVGGTQQISSNARIIAATNKDLFAEVAGGRFREDLAYRLKVININLPPLRERQEDIPLLTQALIQRIALKIHKPALPLTVAALATLQTHDWPGNVRELENLLTQALVQATGNALTPDLFPLQDSAPSPAATSVVQEHTETSKSLEQVEAEHIQRVLNQTGGHKGNSCAILGISRPALDRKIKKFSLTMPKAP